MSYGIWLGGIKPSSSHTLLPTLHSLDNKFVAFNTKERSVCIIPITLLDKVIFFYDGLVRGMSEANDDKSSKII